MKATVAPNRNMVFLALAGAVAVDRQVPAIAYAAHAGDHPIYPDCRPEFISVHVARAAPGQLLPGRSHRAVPDLHQGGHRRARCCAQGAVRADVVLLSRAASTTAGPAGRASSGGKPSSWRRSTTRRTTPLVERQGVGARRWLVVFGKQDRGGRAVGLGDEPDPSAVDQAERGEDARAVDERVVRALVGQAELARVQLDVARRAAAR